MSKERLETDFVIETAKREVVIAKGINNTRNYVNLPIDLVLVLIEQAERAEELVRKQFNLMVELRKLDDRAFDDKEAIDQLKKENNRYKQALEDIKRILDLYPHVDYSKSVTRRRLFDLANEALEGEG